LEVTLIDGSTEPPKETPCSTRGSRGARVPTLGAHFHREEVLGDDLEPVDRRALAQNALVVRGTEPHPRAERAPGGHCYFEGVAGGVGVAGAVAVVVVVVVVVFSTFATVPFLSVQSFSLATMVMPLPLQEFVPAQLFDAVEHEPLPLQLLMPMQCTVIDDDAVVVVAGASPADADNDADAMKPATASASVEPRYFVSIRVPPERVRANTSRARPSITLREIDVRAAVPSRWRLLDDD
jgi:hypothetical protein